MGATWTVVKCQKMERGNGLGDVGIGTPFSLHGSALRRPGVNGAAFLCRDTPMREPTSQAVITFRCDVWSVAWAQGAFNCVRGPRPGSGSTHSASFAPVAPASPARHLPKRGKRAPPQWVLRPFPNHSTRTYVTRSDWLREEGPAAPWVEARKSILERGLQDDMACLLAQSPGPSCVLIPPCLDANHKQFRRLTRPGSMSPPSVAACGYSIEMPNGILPYDLSSDRLPHLLPSRSDAPFGGFTWNP